MCRAAVDETAAKVGRVMGAANKLLMTASMEQQSKTGHDVIALPSWEVHNHAVALAPVDDVMRSG